MVNGLVACRPDLARQHETVQPAHTIANNRQNSAFNAETPSPGVSVNPAFCDRSSNFSAGGAVALRILLLSARQLDTARSLNMAPDGKAKVSKVSRMDASKAAQMEETIRKEQRQVARCVASHKR